MHIKNGGHYYNNYKLMVLMLFMKIAKAWSITKWERLLR